MHTLYGVLSVLCVSVCVFIVVIVVVVVVFLCSYGPRSYYVVSNYY